MNRSQMEKIFVAVSFTLVMPSMAHAVSVAVTKDEFCANRKIPTYSRELIQDYRNQLSFLNEGGLGGGGVCWWHSMFTRKATYLAYYRPDLNRPSREKAKELIRKIKGGKSVVVIPGFKNLNDFSREHGDLIQDQLESWQVSDGLFGFGFIRGMKGKSELTPEKLRKEMDELYREVVQKNEIIYQKLQFPGIMAHAWLVVDMKKLSDGYELTVVDSNSGTNKHVYRFGDTGLNYHGYADMAPHTSRNGGNDRFGQIQKDYCSGKQSANSRNRNPRRAGR